MTDNQQPPTSAVGQALAALQEKVAAGDAMSAAALDGLDAEELARVVRLQECLVRLEQARPGDSAPGISADGAASAAGDAAGEVLPPASHEGSTARPAHGSTHSNPGNGDPSSAPTIGFTEATPDAASGGSVGEKSNADDAAGASAPAGPSRIGRFEIVRVFGRGGQGLMLLAHDPVLAREVALKVPWSETLMTPQLRRRFLREAQAVARLTHPHIVAVYEVGEIGPVCYIASAYVRGQSLSAWLKGRTARVDPRAAAEMVADLADAMHYAHGQGVLHRDLKPGNVLLAMPEMDSSIGGADRASWVVKITDFGLAKILDLAADETRTGAIIGTPAYMSPEQAKADHAAIGPATDVYALGAILYELLSGRPPFRARSDAETLRLVVEEQPAAPGRSPRLPARFGSDLP